MMKKGKELVTQRTLRGNPTLSHKADYQGLREPKHQKVLETSADDIMERPSETQIKGAIEPTENGRDPVGDPTRNPVVDSVGGHRGNSTGDA